MKNHIPNIPSVFTALWVAQNDNGQDLKEWLNIKLKVGITNPEVCEDVKNQYNRFLEFEPNDVLYSRLERFFVQNFAIANRWTKTTISFTYKSSNWSNMVFLKMRGDEVEYMRTNIKELLPLLSKNDCLVNLPLDEICQIFGKTAPEMDLCDDTHGEWQDHLQMNIVIYRSSEGRINTLKDLISIGAHDYDETITLVANQPAYEVIFVYTHVYIHVYIRLFTFIYLAFATTKTAQPADDSPRAKMASVLLPIVRPDMMTSFLSEWEYWFVLTNSTTDKRFPGKLKCKYISNRIYTYIYTSI